MSKEKKIEALCGNCAFWREIPATGTVEIGAEKRGTCYALPPTPIMRLHPATGQPMGQGHARPLPLASETCGMFAEREAILNG